MAYGVKGYMIRRDRLAGILRINALNDENLAEIGLRRKDIPAFVLGDVLTV